MTRVARIVCLLAGAVFAGGCGDEKVHHPGSHTDGGGGDDDGGDAGAGLDAHGGGDGGGGGIDGGGSGSGSGSGSAGIIDGGPCAASGGAATAYRVRFMGTEGSTAQVVYEVDGLPDKSRDHTGVFGFSIPFDSTFTDTFLGDGGVQLDDSDFIDIELSTAGVSQISRATLSIFGRSFNTTASGSFGWQTFDGTGSSPIDLVSNSAPYEWYSADMTTELSPGDSGVLLRITSGPSSDALVVNRIELCVDAQ